ncbi:MAG TPA: hypothetical protein PLZ56_13280 [Anaerolineae bacterium]|nr:hypothetical protein [Anaerolineae bacterium]
MSHATQRLLQALSLLDQVEQPDGSRALTALGFQLDEWLRFDAAIPLPDGGEWPERGHLLAAQPDRAWWLLPGARLLELRTGEAEPRVAPLLELDIDPAALAGFLRPQLLRWHLGAPLTELEDGAIPSVVSELVTAAFEASPAGRAAILETLDQAMAPGAGWEQVALRLRAAFERGLGDRGEGVRRLSARALVRMATGQAPAGASGDPARLLDVLLHMPRDDVRQSALETLLQAPPEALMAVAGRLGPLLAEAMALPSGEIRRLAGLLQMRLEGRSDALAISEGLGSEDAEARAAAVARLQVEAQSNFDVLMPRLLEALEDPDPVLRQASLTVLQQQVDAAGSMVFRRVLLNLLASAEPRAVVHGAGLVQRRLPEGGPDLRADADLMAALRKALDEGPADARDSVALLWWQLHQMLDPDSQVEALRRLLQHADPVVRQVALRELMQSPLTAAAARDGLLKILVERLADPDPSLQLLTARAILAQGYPHADDIVAALAYDRSQALRQGAVQILRQAGAPAAERAESVARQADLLLDWQSADADTAAAARWFQALRAVQLPPSPRLPALLLAVLTELPAQAETAFQLTALDEIDALLSRLAADDTEWLGYCRRLMEPPHPAPGHAARLAARRAADDPRSLHFLWACATAGSPEASRAARLALLTLAPSKLDDLVKAELAQLARGIEDPELRRLLARLLGRPPAG